MSGQGGEYHNVINTELSAAFVKPSSIIGSSEDMRIILLAIMFPDIRLVE
jgi:hypothetical protein